VFASQLKHVSVLPLSAATAAVVILLGTAMGQAGHDEGNEALIATNPMAGMKMPGMDMAGKDAGMDMAGKDAGMNMAGKDAGMDMAGKDAGMDMAGKDAGMDMAGKDAGMDMAGKDAGMNMAGKNAGMKMSGAAMAMTPGMAAQMPGGVHTACEGTTSCRVIFAKGASGTASVLGFKTRLTALSAKSASLSVGGHRVVLHGQKAVRYHGLTLKITRMSAKEVWIRVVKTA